MNLNVSDIINKLDVGESKSLTTNLDIFLLWKTLEYFKPESILEIGIYQGRTLALFSEAASEKCIIDGIDIDTSNIHDEFRQFYETKNINIIECNSKKLNLQKSKSYDFVHIDGDHSYDFVMSDFTNIKNNIKNSSIICFDDYNPYKGVQQAVNEIISTTKWDPFLIGDSHIWLHHESYDISDFTNNYLCKGKSQNFVKYQWQNINNVHALVASTPEILNKFNKIFIEAINYYNL